ncbi:glycogen debranching protein GlgX [Microbacterium radiodurans]|uniref:Glycogen debranching protein GlgX n=1 Tax=Microbacterium radiodurans TaxID=661398 RepID=A0A5J5IU86_9MICO|nr:glycogen debranching protein GlgX [Microbacterium radiodurans]KAA9086874.1 glycogen debranching protein GlgX [Microbacterium radiodurans]
MPETTPDAPPVAASGERVPAAAVAPRAKLGVHLDANGGGTLRVWSAAASSMDLVIFDDEDLDWAVDERALRPVGDDVWEVSTPSLRAGTRYALRVDGPHAPGNTFNPQSLLLDPYARGIVSGGPDDHRSVVVASSFAWNGVEKPRVPMDRTVIYEAHVKGLTKRHPDIPPALHGTYAGLGHPAMIEHLSGLGVTSVELLPIHAFDTEPRLRALGLSNYWGYNSLSFFAPHPGYATEEARRSGATAILDELKLAVRNLHEAGIEVLLDVVYNHTAELELGGPRSSLRGIDNRAYYRQLDDGAYVDVTGCGNSLDTSHPAAARLVLDSLRFWSEEMQIDGFRFDLAATLGRDASHAFDAEHPLLRGIAEDDVLRHDKLIAEPWDIGMGGWQTGFFGRGWHEWNDRYRDGVRNFWLSDIEYMRRAGTSPASVGGLATHLAGSAPLFGRERGPLASVNFVTAHDGFTLHDLVAYEVKHNDANGEHGRDGAETNRSFNHGAEGETDDPRILTARRRAMRNLAATLLLSAGVPMLTAGDEFGRSQNGNNNAYCLDGPLTWLDWQHSAAQTQLTDHVRHLLRLRREHPALRPVRYAAEPDDGREAPAIRWYDETGAEMTHERWTDAAQRTLQYLVSSTSGSGPVDTVLVVIHGCEDDLAVTLPAGERVDSYRSLWSSEHDDLVADDRVFAPGDRLDLHGPSVHVLSAS